MAKFRLLRDLLVEKSLIKEQQIKKPISISRNDLEHIHTYEYHSNFSHATLTHAQLRRIGLPATRPLIQRTWLSVGGTLMTARLAIQQGIACHLAGGTHHAHPNFGSGFCIFNDCAVAASVLLHRGEVERLMIIDLDVHQGDGTAACFKHEPRVFTFSAHASKNFPLRKIASDCDIALPDNTADDQYIQAIGDQLPNLLDTFKPKLVLYNAGVDPHIDDKLGRLAMSDEGLLRRDQLVLDACLRRQIPIATVIGGGYDQLDPLVQKHAIIIRAAIEQARLYSI